MFLCVYYNPIHTFIAFKAHSKLKYAFHTFNTIFLIFFCQKNIYSTQLPSFVFDKDPKIIF